MGLEEQTERADLAELLRRYRGDLEPALSLRDDQALGGQTVQQLPHRADAGAVAPADCVEPQAFTGRQMPEQDVRANARMDHIADRLARMVGAEAEQCTHGRTLSRFAPCRNHRIPCGSYDDRIILR